MTTTHATPAALTTALPGRLVAGAAAGLAGGVVFGLLMQAMNMIGMVAALVGSTSTGVGWLVHLAISAVIGASFAVVLPRGVTGLAATTVAGLGYGIVWWVLGPLLLMPATLGMPLFSFGTVTWQSLMGHMMFGLVLGIGYTLARRATRRGTRRG